MNERVIDAIISTGDRIEGLMAHRGKSGTVIAIWNYPRILVRWDGGRKNSKVHINKLKKVET